MLSDVHPFILHSYSRVAGFGNQAWYPKPRPLILGYTDRVPNLTCTLTRTGAVFPDPLQAGAFSWKNAGNQPRMVFNTNQFKCIPFNWARFFRFSLACRSVPGERATIKPGPGHYKLPSIGGKPGPYILFLCSRIMVTCRDCRRIRCLPQECLPTHRQAAHLEVLARAPWLATNLVTAKLARLTCGRAPLHCPKPRILRDVRNKDSQIPAVVPDLQSKLGCRLQS